MVPWQLRAADKKKADDPESEDDEYGEDDEMGEVGEAGNRGEQDASNGDEEGAVMVDVHGMRHTLTAPPGPALVSSRASVAASEDDASEPPSEGAAEVAMACLQAGRATPSDAEGDARVELPALTPEPKQMLSSSLLIGATRGGFEEEEQQHGTNDEAEAPKPTLASSLSMGATRDVHKEYEEHEEHEEHEEQYGYADEDDEHYDYADEAEEYDGWS